MSITILHDFREDGPLRNSSDLSPDSVDKMETSKEGSSVVIETITSFNQVSTGVYEAEVTEDKYKEDVDYQAKWYWTEDNVQYISVDEWHKTVFRLTDQVDAWINLIIDVVPDWVSCSDLYQDLANIVGSEIFEIRQALEEDVRKSAHIETASSDALDRHADELGLQRRQGEDDASLRQRIALQLRLLRAGGTIDDIQNMLIAAAQVEANQNWDADDIQLKEFFDRGDYAYFRISINLDQLLAIGRSEMERIIQDTKSAGVGFQLKSVGEFGYVGVNSTASDYPDVEPYNGLDSNNAPKDVGGRYSGINQTT